MKNQLRNRVVSLLAGENPPFTQVDLKENISLDPRAMRVCCGRAIEPYLAEMLVRPNSRISGPFTEWALASPLSQRMPSELIDRGCSSCRA